MLNSNLYVSIENTILYLGKRIVMNFVIKNVKCSTSWHQKIWDDNNELLIAYTVSHNVQRNFLKRIQINLTIYLSNWKWNKSIRSWNNYFCFGWLIKKTIFMNVSVVKLVSTASWKDHSFLSHSQEMKLSFLLYFSPTHMGIYTFWIRYFL